MAWTAGGAGCSSITKPNQMSIRLRHLFLVAIIFCGSFLLLSMNNMSKPYVNNDFLIFSRLGKKDSGEILSDEMYTIRTNGCIISALQPLGSEVRQLVKFPIDIKPCPMSDIALLSNNRTHIWIKHENRQYYNISKSVFLKCCYKSFYRPLSVEDITSRDVDKRVKYNVCFNFTTSIKAAHEFVRVKCYVRSVEIYDQFFIFAPKKELSSDETEIPKNKTAYNVIIMGIDGVSRLNFHRTMPKTFAFLEKKGGVELLGYNKVGDNSFPNLIPMLMGLSEQDLKSTCTPRKKSTFDNCPFIWEWFKEAGYYTALGEDSASLGTFNYGKFGFIGSPTDYYLHTFMNEAEENAGVNKDFNSYLCMNDKYFYKVLLDYIENLAISLRTSKLFAFFWEVTMTHDYLNYPMIMDEDYVNFLTRLDSINYWNETILILISDHGIRYGQIRSTNQGRLEERLPFAYILIPEDFKEKYKEAYNNLQLNSKRLSTPYDIHAMLSDLVNLDNIENDKIVLRSNRNENNVKGNSLFLPIPLSRTCSSAHISDHWCSCQKSHKISTKSKLGKEVADQLVQQLNNLVSEYEQCAKLKLAELIEVVEMEPNSFGYDSVTWREFMVMVKTVPGNGLFEGTLRVIDNEWLVAGSISRFNLYGNQSHCIQDTTLKLYCYCQ
ncbi:unnamed protein product [Danaus chrysippus]|uniref:(African queen) hypothetical protein n=1 Tax=Danaus chrysippus TaxID=151541 RepID=A0A8J2QPM2_9NEOP|nr:unnamed protein product [Danaus chrysippus]